MDYFGSAIKNFSVLNLNIQSLNAKFEKLTIFLDELAKCNFTFSAICLQETWLGDFSPDVSDLNIPDYVSIPLRATCSSHGGLMIYLHKDFQYNVKDFYNPNDKWEGQFLDVYGNGLTQKIALCNVYRPPRDRNADIENFMNDIFPIIETISREPGDKMIVGDFNINLLKMNTRAKYADFLDMIFNSGFVPQIIFPTRFSERNATLIDNIFCNTSHCKKSCLSGIVLTDISDHMPCFTFIDQALNIENPPKYILAEKLDSNSVHNFYDEINNCNIMQLLDTNSHHDPNINYSTLETILTKAKEKHMPIRKIKFNKYKHKKNNWISNGILRSIKFRDNLYKKLKCTSHESPLYGPTKINLKTYNQILNKCIREQKRNYYYSKFAKYRNDVKKTWDTIRSVMDGNRFKNRFPLAFKINGKIITDKHQIAECFNQFFTNIGPNLAAQVNNGNSIPFTSYLSTPNDCNFAFSHVSPDDISMIFKNFKPKTSSGQDGISMYLLKGLVTSLSVPLALIVNQSLTTGIFPDKLKIAKVLPLYKKDDNSLLDNYRPISLLPAISKVFEKVVYNQLYEFFVSKKLFYASQHGFRKLHSTETAAMELTDRLLQILDTGDIPVTIFLDLSKAFDTLNHEILFHKLNYYGIKGTPLNWFRNYFTNRKQYVKFDDVSSKCLSITTGVPQGSILGPLLFIIYTNDMYLASSKFESIFYADDTTLINSLSSFNFPLKDTDSVSNSIEIELNKVCDWLSANKLSINIAKTKYMVFHFPQRKINFTLNLKIKNVPIYKTSDFDFLGLRINENLNWHSHVNKIGNKLSKIIGVMKRTQNYFPQDILLQIYNSLFLPHLNYCILLWGFSCDRIFKLQKKAVRVVCLARYNAHTDPLFKTLNLLQVPDILKLRSLKFYYRYLENKTPDYFNNIFAATIPSHRYFTRHRNDSQVPIPSRNSTKHCIRYYLPTLLKNTQPCIKDKFFTHSYNGFATYIKLFFVKQYKDTCTVAHCYVCGN